MLSQRQEQLSILNFTVPFLKMLAIEIWVVFWAMAGFEGLKGGDVVTPKNFIYKKSIKNVLITIKHF